MKTAIRKHEGYYRLELMEDKVNRFHKSPEPILLGSISHYAMTNHWIVLDFRLGEHLLPSAYLIDSVEEYTAKDSEELNLITPRLEHFNVSEENPLHIYWNRYENAVFENADKCPTKEDIKQFLYIPRHACFSFEAAKEKLSEMKKYWESVQAEQITAEHLVHNPHRQLHSTVFSLEKYLRENSKMKIELTKKRV